nr:DUF2867 domain-containing protein [uncultured Brevundimonas sp.]
MPRSSQTAIRPAPSPMPHAVLPDADWGDAYVTRSTASTARQALEHMMRQTDGWPAQLLALRNRLARLVGLHAASFALGAHGGFPVVSETPDEIVLGFNDRHLDFRIVATLLHGPATQLRVATLVERHGLAGRAYIALIAPFHRMIVRHMMRRQTEIQ